MELYLQYKEKQLQTINRKYAVQIKNLDLMDCIDYLKNC